MVNRLVQSWAPRVPSEDRQIIGCKYMPLCLLRGRIFNQIGVKDQHHTERHKRYQQQEIDHIREIIRSRYHLDMPTLHRLLTSLDGLPLDDKLLSSSCAARDKRSIYFGIYMEYEQARMFTRITIPVRNAPIFITPG